MASVVKQIEGVEHNIKTCEHRLDEIERSLRLRKLTEKERDQLECEEEELRKNLKEYETHLWSLRKENMKTMCLSCIVLGIVYIAYVILWKQ